MGREIGEDPEARELFLHEARAMAALNHPGIVTLHDAGVEGATPFLVMEYLRGRPLRELLIPGAPFLPERTILRYGAQVADALTAVHAKRLSSIAT